MTSKLKNVLFFALIIHVATALIVIVYPSILPPVRIFGLYKVFILPGPFFSEGRIEQSDYFLLSWKLDNDWTASINPVLINHNRYYSDWNPSMNYRSRFEWTLYYRFITRSPSADNPTSTGEFKRLSAYLKEKYVPQNADSIRLIGLRKTAAQHHIKLDTIETIRFR